MTVRAPSKWLNVWRLSLKGFKPQPQVIGYWLAVQADENGVVDGIDWEELSAATGITTTTLRKELKSGELISTGKVKREPRQWGNTFGATLYQLNLEDLPEPDLMP